MKVAFVSYEFPAETGGGGIGTYLEQTRRVFPQGYRMIVIAGTLKQEPFWENENVFRIPSRSWEEFNNVCVTYFEKLNKQFQFDVVEGTDFKASGLSIKKAFPNLPLVVKLHTPSFLVDTLQFKKLAGWRKLRFLLSSFMRFKFPKLNDSVPASAYKDEFEILKLADALHAPSQSIFSRLVAMGMISSPPPICNVFPYNYDLREFLALPAKKNEPGVVTFLGRKEARKGVIEFATVCKRLAKKFPRITFQFIGNSASSPSPGVSMDDYLKKFIGQELNNVKVLPAVPHEKIPEVYRESSIMVFPSHYESFGLVCAEAMAAGKAVIASRFGGMSEMIEDGKSGVLIDPLDVDAFTDKLQTLLNDGAQCESLGRMARIRAGDFFSRKNTIEKQIAGYRLLLQEE
jgi:glycogen(starch) synthase